MLATFLKGSQERASSTELQGGLKCLLYGLLAGNPTFAMVRKRRHYSKNRDVKDMELRKDCEE